MFVWSVPNTLGLRFSLAGRAMAVALCSSVTLGTSHAATLTYSLSAFGNVSAAGFDRSTSCLPSPSPGTCADSASGTVTLAGSYSDSVAVSAFARASNGTGETFAVTADTLAQFSVLDGSALLKFSNTGGSVAAGGLGASVGASAQTQMTLSITEKFRLAIAPNLQGQALDFVIRHLIDGSVTSQAGSLPSTVRFTAAQSSSLNDGDSLLRDFTSPFGGSLSVDDVLQTEAIIQRTGTLSPAVDVTYTFTVQSTSRNASHDFLNTIGLELVLPEGVTLTSESGLFENFVTAPAAVPEPGTLALLASGIIALVMLRRRRSRGHGDLH